MFLTIGHSNHPIAEFVALLRRHEITALADVRSTPYSRFHPQFNRDRLRDSLAAASIEYVFLGKELGARTQDPTCYDAEGRVSYSRLAATAAFRSGIERLEAGMQKFRVAIMCAEREPLTCHRTMLVGRALVGRGHALEHVLHDGSLEGHDRLMRRLIAELKLSEADLFQSPEELSERAYAIQGQRIAYVKPAGRRGRK